MKRSESKIDEPDAKAAGQVLREARQRQGLTLAQVAESTTIPGLSYLGNMETGRIHAGRSKHLASLAELLKLTERDLTRITGQPTLEGTADVRDAVRLELQDGSPQPPGSLKNLADLRNAATLTVAAVLGGQWQNSAVGSYRLPDDPEIILVVDPQQRDLEIGRHYLALDPLGHTIVRAVCVQEGAALKLLQGGSTILDGAVVMGRVLFEAHPL